MRQPGKGSTVRSSAGFPPAYQQRRIMTAFDEEIFSHVRARALIEKTTIAEQIRRLVKRGLFVEEAE